jgi:NAD(P)-dependent dehydrogenase (short-subunit alcohol dehydrogenase family)/acyl carrier protein
MTEHDPQYVARLFSDVMGLVADHRLPTLPITTAEITSAADVFRTMAGAGHVGKLVLTVPNTPVPADIGPVRADSTYLVTGGLGALGLATAERLVDIGARHLALLGRSAPSDHAAAHIDGLRGRGVDVRVVAVDVTDADALGARLAEVRATMPPLRGVVHAAGALADATIAEMDRARLRAALDPKLAGGWNLHQATLDDPLDLFVMVSSVAGVLGLTGQANYAAGNAFLDSLAAARRAVDRPGLSIDWGPWADIGLAAAAADRGDRLAERGLHSVSPVEALDAFERLLDDDRAQAVVMRLDATRWIAGTQAPTLVAETAGSAATTTSGDDALRDRLAEAPAGARRRLVMEEAVRAQLAPVLRVAPERIDRNRPLEAMGLDSLMSLEFRNRLEVETGLKLSATLAFNYPTVAHLAAHLADRMNVALDSTDTPDVIDQPPASTEPASTDVASGDPAAELSDDDVERLLGEELAAVDRLLDGDGRAQ